MKRLACRLGRHKWTTRVEEGESYEVCVACGKEPRRPDRYEREPDPDLPGGGGGGDPGVGAGGDAGGGGY
jgi:hypothetical protein